MVTIRHRETGEEREVTRTAANALSRRWKIVGEETATTASPNAKPLPANPAVGGEGPDQSEKLEIIQGLRDQYKQLTGKDASGLWSEETLMSQIEFALEDADKLKAEADANEKAAKAATSKAKAEAKKAEKAEAKAEMKVETKTEEKGDLPNA